MSVAAVHRRRRLAAASITLLVLATIAGLTLRAEAGRSLVGDGLVGVQPTLGIPATNVNPIGTAPAGQPGEAWAYGTLEPGSAAYAGGQRIATDSTGFVFLRHSDTTNWQVVQGALDGGGQRFGYFAPVSGPGAGRTTRRGGVALIGFAGVDSGHASPVVLARNPGSSSISPLTAPLAGTVLEAGESLAASDDVAFAAIDESDRTGVFVAPQSSSGSIDGILHWNGAAWAREQIDLPAELTSVRRVRAVAASSTGNAWFLADATGTPSPGIALFQRVDGPAPHWVHRALGNSPFAKRDPGGGVESIRPLPYPAESLTATDDGVWIDGSMVRSNVGATQDTFTLYYGAGSHQVSSWCNFDDLPNICQRPLNFSLSALAPTPPGYRSFAWGGVGRGTRAITNVLRAGQPLAQSSNSGTYAVFEGDEFTRRPGAGAPFVDGKPSGGAFSGKDDGWLGGRDDLVRITRSPKSSRLQPYPVPFREPLIAIAAEPGKSPGDSNTQAIAVGDRGAIARYSPGGGWAPEFLLNSNGSRAKPRLRGVAWPEPGRAYAVGDLGEMWLWQSETGLWERDQAVPLEFNGNLMDVGFQPGSGARGYAVGRDGVLLAYGKNWEQESLPAGAQHDDFSRVAFAGSQALVAGQNHLLVNDGDGWRIDQGIANLIHTETGDRGTVYAVAGLPDGGAVAAGFDFVATRDSVGAPWRLVDQPINRGTVVAAAALRDAGQVRAVVSINRDSRRYPTDLSSGGQPDPTQPPLILQPFSLPLNGFLLRQTAAGWSDEQHEAFRTLTSGSAGSVDAPIQPDPVFALLLDQDGRGWAVGGKTGELFDGPNKTRAHTAGVFRYPATGSAPPGAGVSLPPLSPSLARFAIGGDARCVGPCSDQALQGIRADVGLNGALAQAGSLTAASTHGPRAFLYAGGRLESGTLDAPEARRYATVAGNGGSALPFYAAPSAHDASCGTQQAGSGSAYARAFDPFPAPFGHGTSPTSVDIGDVPLTPAGPGARTHYAFDSVGSAGTVRVIVIDNSCGSLQASDAAGQNPNEPQRPWLELVLGDARAHGISAIVVGSRDLRASSPANVASDGESIAQLLADQGASAYFYDSPRENRRYLVPSGAANSVPEFGSGTLGYGTSIVDQFQYFGENGYLLIELDAANRDPNTNRSPIYVRLMPLLEDLALDATDGLLLRRSRVALFEALGRRPRAGELDPSAGSPEDPYVTLPPKPCVTAACNSRVEPEFSFTSSNPDIGDFVRHDSTSANLRAVYLGTDGKPISDPRSGLFCAFNAGKTTVTVQAGNLAFSQQVTVQQGSVRRPCGTRPLTNPPAKARHAANPSAPFSTPAAPNSPPAVNASIPQIPAPPAPSPPPPVTPFVPAVLVPPVVDARVPPLVPPPPAGMLRPTPPSGFSSVRVEEQEREDEPAYEDQMASSSYRPQDPGMPPAFMVGIALIAALAGASLIRGRPRRRPVPSVSRVPLADRTVRKRTR